MKLSAARTLLMVLVVAVWATTRYLLHCRRRAEQDRTGREALRRSCQDMDANDTGDQFHAKPGAAARLDSPANSVPVPREKPRALPWPRVLYLVVVACLLAAVVVVGWYIIHGGLGAASDQPGGTPLPVTTPPAVER